MIWRLACTTATALALIAAAPSFAQERGGAVQEYSLLNADRAHKLGLQLYRQQNYEAALRQFEKAVSLAPGVDTYRASLHATRLRVVQQQANQKAAKQNADRLRHVFDADEAEAAEQNEADRPRSDRAGAKAAPRRPADGSETQPLRSTAPFGADQTQPRSAANPFDVDEPQPRRADQKSTRRSAEPLSTEDMLNEENRKLRLGGGNLSPSRVPPDLPIAGMGFDLPLFTMPRELLDAPVVARPTPDDLEPAEDDSGNAGAPDPARLDRPVTLP